MILVDTSVWIEILAGRFRGIGADQFAFIGTCAPILQEVLQGLRPGPESAELRQSMLALPCLCDPLPRRVYVHAAEIFGEGRRRGYTIRSSTDCLIAAISIETGAAVWHRDRDYRNIGKFTSLLPFPSSSFPY